MRKNKQIYLSSIHFMHILHKADKVKGGFLCLNNWNALTARYSNGDTQVEGL